MVNKRLYPDWGSLDGVGAVVLGDEVLDAELTSAEHLLARLVAGPALVSGIHVLVEEHAHLGGQVQELQVLQVAVTEDTGSVPVHIDGGTAALVDVPPAMARQLPPMAVDYTAMHQITVRWDCGAERQAR